jgi:hypothetical protein
MTQLIPSTTLYDRDFVAWCDDIVAKLKARAFDRLDLEHLIEEVQGLANRDRKEVESRLIVLLAHLLKRIYVPSPYDYRGWENPIEEQRLQLNILLKYSPSLQNLFISLFDEAWRYALKTVRKGYPEVQFPDEWQFSSEIEALLSEDFWLSDRQEQEESTS